MSEEREALFEQTEVASDEEETDPTVVLQPSSQDQREALMLLDAVDEVIPVAMRAWRVPRLSSRKAPSDWLLAHIQEILPAEDDHRARELRETLTRHKVSRTTAGSQRKDIWTQNGLISPVFVGPHISLSRRSRFDRKRQWIVGYQRKVSESHGTGV